MGDLVDKITDNNSTADEQDAWMKIFSDIVLAAPNQTSVSGEIWREGYLDKLDFLKGFFSDFHLGGEWADEKGDIKNVNILASWVNHFDVLDREFQGYDEGTNQFLAKIGYTYPKNLGQGRRMFTVTNAAGDSVSKLGYDLGIGFKDKVITRTLQDKKFFESQGITDDLLEEVVENGKKLYRIKEDVVEVVQGEWVNPNQKLK